MTSEKQPRPNSDLALRYWSDSTLSAWHWQTDLRAWCLCAHPDFHTGTTWRVGHERPTEPPQKMCELAGMRFPMPITEAPNEGDAYWVVMTDHIASFYWDGTEIGRQWLWLRMCHTSQSAAEQHRNALLAANMQAVGAAK